jgi:geranylgeranyl diphosphate synthase type II
MSETEAWLRACAVRLEQALPAFLPPAGDLVIQAMYYSLEGGGKRIRPALVFTFCELFGGNAQAAMPLAAALEMIHTYSLIHDDLPCMDNDDYRRGRLSCHRKFGETYALLAGDALLTEAFRCIAAAADLSPELRCNAAALLAKAAGAQGMIAGQALDLQYEARKITRAQLEEMNQKKTGALIDCACALGCLAAGAEEPQTATALRYAGHIGLLFQLTDDILDVIGNTAKTGKSQGKDAKSGKNTWVKLLGLKRAQMYAKELAVFAKQELVGFAPVEHVLMQLPDWLAEREF